MPPFLREKTLLRSAPPRFPMHCRRDSVRTTSENGIHRQSKHSRFWLSWLINDFRRTAPGKYPFVLVHGGRRRTGSAYHASPGLRHMGRTPRERRRTDRCAFGAAACGDGLKTHRKMPRRTKFRPAYCGRQAPCAFWSAYAGLHRRSAVRCPAAQYSSRKIGETVLRFRSCGKRAAQKKRRRMLRRAKSCPEYGAGRLRRNLLRAASVFFSADSGLVFRNRCGLPAAGMESGGYCLFGIIRLSFAMRSVLPEAG